MSFLGIDIGTSSVKAVLVEGDGSSRTTATAAYTTAYPAPGLAEQSMADWQRAVMEAVSGLGNLRGLAGVGIVGHTPTLVLIDKERRAVGPALTWQDNRAVSEAHNLSALGPPSEIVGATLPWSPSYLPAKLLWLARHTSLQAVRWLMQPKDALGFALTGEAATDVWGSKGLCRIDDGEPVLPVFELADLSPSLLPPRCSPWALLGTVDLHGAAWSGVPNGVPVAVGWTDALSGVLGVGAFEQPASFVLTGTSDIVGTSGTELCFGNVLNVPASCAPLTLSYGPTQSSGASIEWLARVIGRTVPELFDLAMTAVDAHTPLYLPFLGGERAPLWRSELRAAFDGIDPATGAAELAFGALRGVALSNRHVLNAAGGTAVGPVLVGGRSAQHPAWLRARLETLGAPMRVRSDAEVTARGAAMLGAIVATGATPADVSKLFAGKSHDYEPTSAQVQRGDELFSRYRATVAARIQETLTTS